MLKYVFFFLLPFYSLGQLSSEKEGYYLEDQLYVGFAYNVFNKAPNSVKQSGFSNSISLGFIKDIPINKKRNIGFGLGLGYSHDIFFHNIKIEKTTLGLQFSNFEADDSYKKNRLIVNSLEIPFEFRFRTSNNETYKFWRFYPGIKYKYIFHSIVKYQLNGSNKIKNIDKLNKSQLGLTLGFGYGTWNGYVYYGLNKMFDDVLFNGNEFLDINILQIGLQFYIL